jgi:ribonuclease kappa
LFFSPPISTVISVFGIVILSIIGGLYKSGHEEFVGGVDDPTDGKAVAGTIFTAVIVYAVCQKEF